MVSIVFTGDINPWRLPNSRILYILLAGLFFLTVPALPFAHELQDEDGQGGSEQTHGPHKHGNEDMGGSLEIDIPQHISVSSTIKALGNKQAVLFSVMSSNGFDISFSGDSPTDDGGRNGYSVFTKPDVNVNGQVISDRYDHLDTAFGIAVTHFHHVEHQNHWGGGASMTGTPQQLVLPLDQSRPTPGSPDAAIGRILPMKNSQTAQFTLFVKPLPRPGAQSGRYTLTVTLTVTSDPM